MCEIAVVVFNVTGGSGWHLSSCSQTNFRTMTFSYNASREMMYTGKLSIYQLNEQRELGQKTTTQTLKFLYLKIAHD